jgi:hypothetical protein
MRFQDEEELPNYQVSHEDWYSGDEVAMLAAFRSGKGAEGYRDNNPIENDDGYYLKFLLKYWEKLEGDSDQKNPTDPADLANEDSWYRSWNN